MVKILELLEINAVCTFSEWEKARKKWNRDRNLLVEENIFVYNLMEYLLFYEQTVSSAWVNEFCLLGNYTLIIFITVLIYSLQILCRINNRYDRKMDQMIIAAVNRAFLSGGDPLYTKKNIDGAKAAGILSLGFLRYLLDI